LKGGGAFLELCGVEHEFRMSGAAAITQHVFKTHCAQLTA
jgi:hypothetical protein